MANDAVGHVTTTDPNETVPGGAFDVAISQFGVMFFDEPETAFANIRRQLVSGGRLAFACWHRCRVPGDRAADRSDGPR